MNNSLIGPINPSSSYNILTCYTEVGTLELSLNSI